MALTLVGVGALAAALVGVPVAAALAARIGLVDEPGELKVHTRAVPYLGGVGVAAGLAVGLAAARPLLIPGLALLLAVGVADDRKALPPLGRLAAEVGGGLMIGVAAAPRFGAGGIALALAVTVVLVNGVNMIDGLDGLAGGVGLVSAAGLAALAGGPLRTVAVALAASLAGFLWWNRPPARVYLGDGGAYLLGGALAALVALAWRPGVPADRSVAALVMVAYPVSEVVFAVARRLRGGHALTGGDRAHLYDRLVERGWSHATASLGCTALQAALVGVGLLAARGPVGVAVAVAGGGAVTLVLLAGVAGSLAPYEPRPAP